MSNLKPIRLFDTETISGQDQSMQAENLTFHRMIYLDMFFLFLCKEKIDEEQEIEYLYSTKSMEIQKKFMIHHHTLYVDKVVNAQMKLLYTFGLDFGLDENGNILDKAFVIKIWDFT